MRIRLWGILQQLLLEALRSTILLSHVSTLLHKPRAERSVVSCAMIRIAVLSPAWSTSASCDEEGQPLLDVRGQQDPCPILQVPCERAENVTRSRRSVRQEEDAPAPAPREQISLRSVNPEPRTPTSLYLYFYTHK